MTDGCQIATCHKWLHVWAALLIPVIPWTHQSHLFLQILAPTVDDKWRKRKQQGCMRPCVGTGTPDIQGLEECGGDLGRNGSLRELSR